MAKHGPDHLTDDIKRKLCGLGIPPHAHTRESLLAAFPAEFNARSLDLDLEALAKVLIHLCDRGVIKLGAASATGKSRRKA